MSTSIHACWREPEPKRQTASFNLIAGEDPQSHERECVTIVKEIADRLIPRRRNRNEGLRRECRVLRFPSGMELVLLGNTRRFEVFMGR